MNAGRFSNLLAALLALAALPAAVGRCADNPNVAAKQRLSLLEKIDQQGVILLAKQQELSKGMKDLQSKLNSVNASLVAVTREGRGIEGALSQLQQANQNLLTPPQQVQQNIADARALEVKRNELIAKRDGLNASGQGILGQVNMQQAAIDAVSAAQDQLRIEWLAQVDPFGKLAHGEQEGAILALSEWIVREENPTSALVARGFAYRNLGKLDLALADFKRAAAVGGHWGSTALAGFGAVQFAMGSKQEGMASLGRAIGDDKSNSFTRLLRGDAHLAAGNVGSAMTDFKMAVQLNSGNSVALQRMAMILAATDTPSVRNGTKALKMAKQACELTKSGDCDCLESLAAAYAELADFDEAVKWEKKAAELATNESREQCQKRVALYASHSPLRIDWKQ